jgi:hypothetical protein
MDTQKLLNILSDLDNEQEDSSIDTSLQNLASNINSGQTSEIVTNEGKVREFFEESKVNSYVPSNMEIIHFIGADKYFGNSAYAVVKDILNKNTYNVQKTYQELQEYLKRRKKFVETVKETRNNLETLNFEAYYPTDDNYQIGLLMPDDYTKNKITSITKELNKWDKVLKTFKELVGESPEDTEINYVSNGTLEFFIDNSPAIAAALAYSVDKIIKVYKNIVEIRQTREKLKDLGIPQAEQKAIEKQEKEHLSKELDKISADLIKEFASRKIESGRLNEIKVAVKGHVVYMAKCIDNGITIEINPPEVHEPEILSQEETDENKTEIKKAKIDYDKKLKQIEIVQKSMDTVKTIGKFGIDIGKFLTNGDEPNDAE